ncbi:l10-interacting myb domain-containing protein, partial [Quercus suber]
DGMGGLAPSSNERGRTDWTPAMDQFFIELMLDQVKRGNKTENTFNKQAWNDMLASFNEKFGPQHGKRVLRHRYKKLWKYYSDITILLKQNGFSWDETQQMVAADDDVWDAYLKAHPHARTYRTKTLPNYYDLLLIYGSQIDNGIHCDLHQNKNVEDDISERKAGEGKGGQNPTFGDRTRTYWTPPMDRYLIDLLLEQVHRGNKLGQTFITQAWIDMVTSFNAKFNSHHDKDVLKNRYKHLKRQYNDVKILLQLSGFSWDETREMVTADDHVWDAYTKEHPDARSYRVKTLPSYHKLCVIFGEEHADGRYSRLARNADPSGELPVSMTGEGTNDQSPAGHVPLVIDWIPSMELYFIELMVDHVQRGNKADHTFNEQVWADMIESFNEKFGLKFNKNLLEDQYTFLMKQHGEISNLINHSGFTWDESQQMVTADNDVWEAYVKSSPPRSLVLSFRLSPGRLTTSVSISRAGEGTNDQSPAGHVPLVIDWIPSMELYFIELMVDHVQRGNKADHTFNEQVWADMIESFNEKFGLKFNKNLLEDQYTFLMKQHGEISNLINHSGFTWDESQQMVTADNDVWEAYVKEYPDAVSYRDKILCSYRDLCKVFGNKVSGERFSNHGLVMEVDITAQGIEMGRNI